MSDRPPLDVAKLRELGETLGVSFCDIHAPQDELEEAAGLLAALMAVCQWQLQGVWIRREAQATVDLVYHNMRRHLGFPCAGCPSPGHDGPAF